MAFHPDFTPGPVQCHRWQYGQQPYGRVTMGGAAVDRKADAWQGDRILFRWAEGSTRPMLWMDATEFTRIPGAEASWTESSDDVEWYW